jgi:hypothetical protein
MPFTFSHIGFILPFRKKWSTHLSVSGLVFGSIAPDYDILFRLTNVRFHIFQYDLKSILFLIYPLALFSAIGYHLFCRNIIIQNLPSPFEKRYRKFLSFNFLDYLRKNFFRVTLSILFAILFHLFLDALCHHYDAYDTKLLALSYWDNYYFGNVAFFSALYAIPVILSIIGFYLIYRYEFHSSLRLAYFAMPKRKSTFWLSMLVIGLLFCLVKWSITEKDIVFPVDYIVITLASSFILSVYATCLLHLSLQKIFKHA